MSLPKDRICHDDLCKCHDVSVKMKCPRVEMFGRCTVKGCGTCNQLPSPTKPSGWQRELRELYTDPDAGTVHEWWPPSQVIIEDFTCSLLRDKAEEIRSHIKYGGVIQLDADAPRLDMSLGEYEKGENHGLEKAAQLLLN